MTEKKVHKPKACRLCGKLFIPRQSGTHYCDECRARVLENYIKHIKDGEPFHDHCLVCGKEITNAHGKQLFCGGEHAKIAAHITDANRYYGNKDINAFRKWSKTFATSKKVDADNARAKAAGLTYGEYMARKAGLV